MKKTVLLLLLVLTLSCSKEDSNETQVTEQGCYMKVLSLDEGNINGAPIYYLSYGTATNDQVQLVVNKQVYEFYTGRISKANDHWIGEVEKE